MKLLSDSIRRFFGASPDHQIKKATIGMMSARTRGASLPRTPDENPVEVGIVRTGRRLLAAMTWDLREHARSLFGFIHRVRIDPRDLDVRLRSFLMSFDAALAQLRKALDAQWSALADKDAEILAYRQGNGFYREPVYGPAGPVILRSVSYGGLEIILNAGLLFANGYSGGLVAGAAISSIVAVLNILAGYLVAVHIKPEIEPDNGYTAFRRWTGCALIAGVVIIIVVLNVSFATMRLPNGSTLSALLNFRNPTTPGVTLLGLGVAYWIFRKWDAISEPIREYRRLHGEQRALQRDLQYRCSEAAEHCLELARNEIQATEEMLHREGDDLAAAHDALIELHAIVAEYEHRARGIFEPCATRIEKHRALVRNAVKDCPPYFQQPACVEDYFEPLNIDLNEAQSKIAQLDADFDSFERDAKQMMASIAELAGQRVSELECRYSVSEEADSEPEASEVGTPQDVQYEPG